MTCAMAVWLAASRDKILFFAILIIFQFPAGDDTRFRQGGNDQAAGDHGDPGTGCDNARDRGTAFWIRNHKPGRAASKAEATRLTPAINNISVMISGVSFKNTSPSLVRLSTLSFLSLFLSGILMKKAMPQMRWQSCRYRLLLRR